jgi:hypothetical protein
MRGPFPPENNIIPVVTHDNTSGGAPPGRYIGKTNRACRESARCEELQVMFTQKSMKVQEKS